MNFANGKFDGEAVPDNERQTFVKVFAGDSKKTESFTQVSLTPTVSEIASCLGCFVKFVLAADLEKLPQSSDPVDDAFSVLMSSNRNNKSLPSRFSEDWQPGKSKLKNKIRFCHVFSRFYAFYSLFFDRNLCFLHSSMMFMYDMVCDNK